MAPTMSLHRPREVLLCVPIRNERCFGRSQQEVALLSWGAKWTAKGASADGRTQACNDVMPHVVTHPADWTSTHRRDNYGAMGSIKV
jgi:hypothetical protein